jgi:hypothetical protein
MKWRLDFIGPFKPIRKLTRNKYIMVAIIYATTWIDAKAFKTDIVVFKIRTL